MVRQQSFRVIFVLGIEQAITYTGSHERIVLLQNTRTTSQPCHYQHLMWPFPHGVSPTHLLIPNRKFPLRLAMRVRILLQPLQRLILQHTNRKLDIALGVLMARKHLGIVRQRGQRRVQRRLHLRGRALEELAAPGVEQRVAGEHDALAVAVLEEPADAVLRVTWRVQALDGDAAQREACAVGGRAGYAFRVFAADDGEVGEVELLFL